MPALRQATTASFWVAKRLWSVTSSLTAPPSLEITSTPHCLMTMLFRIGLIAIGVPFHALYDAITPLAPPSRKPMRNGTE